MCYQETKALGLKMVAPVTEGELSWLEPDARGYILITESSSFCKISRLEVSVRTVKVGGLDHRVQLFGFREGGGGFVWNLAD